eukprot:15469572-Alexandrium_andersonii.AAC.1
MGSSHGQCAQSSLSNPLEAHRYCNPRQSAVRPAEHMKWRQAFGAFRRALFSAQSPCLPAKVGSGGSEVARSRTWQASIGNPCNPPTALKQSK